MAKQKRRAQRYPFSLHVSHMDLGACILDTYSDYGIKAKVAGQRESDGMYKIIVSANKRVAENVAKIGMFRFSGDM